MYFVGLCEEMRGLVTFVRSRYAARKPSAERQRLRRNASRHFMPGYLHAPLRDSGACSVDR